MELEKCCVLTSSGISFSYTSYILVHHLFFKINNRLKYYIKNNHRTINIKKCIVLFVQIVYCIHIT